jgi:hypothetical protein
VSSTEPGRLVPDSSEEFADLMAAAILLGAALARFENAKDRAMRAQGIKP